MGLVRGLISGLILVVNTLFWCPILFGLALMKFLVPIPLFQKCLNRLMVGVAQTWIWVNDINLRMTQKIEWDIAGVDDLSSEKSYLVVANHQSGMDIFVLQKILNFRIPFLRFFIKRELMFVPILGLAWWALDFPMMRRYSKEYLALHPELRGKDMETTRRALERLRGQPIGILNFLEGTRISPQKKMKQETPYRHLLPPKAGGIAYTLQTMGEKFDCLLDVTIVYPNGPVGLWQALKGKMQKVIVRVRKIPIPAWVLAGDYGQDKSFRDKFQSWLAEIWEAKDQLIETV